MSFAGEIKTELARVLGGARHCRLAELAGLIALADVTAREDRLEIRLDRVGAADKCALLLLKLFDIAPERATEKGRKGQARHILSVVGAEEIARIGAATWRDIGAVTQKDCCRRAFLRGAFLAAGSVSDPNRSWHLEIVCADRERAALLCRILAELSISGRIAERRDQQIVYVKESDEIADVLGLMGSRIGLMELENVRILKDMRERVNRKVNCETANINKTVSAAVKQIEDIRLIDERMGLSALSNGLDEIARVRLQYPEATLQELGEHLSSPVGKSGVNHRLRKISAIAERLRK